MPVWAEALALKSALSMSKGSRTSVVMELRCLQNNGVGVRRARGLSVDHIVVWWTFRMPSARTIRILRAETRGKTVTDAERELSRRIYASASKRLAMIARVRWPGIKLHRKKVIQCLLDTGVSFKILHYRRAWCGTRFVVKNVR